MRPIIGILAEIDDVSTRVQHSYIRAVERAGALPLLLPYTECDEAIAAFADACDGFLFTGGVDIEPARYGEACKETCGEINLFRDALELAVFAKVRATDKPVLGICRGAQLINVACGGTLYQDIPSELQTQLLHRQSEPKLSPSHTVKVLADTPLAALMKRDRIPANSFHHQAVKLLGEGLAVMAVADDGVVEAFYAVEKRYLHAYQWHPERLFETDEYNRRIFEDFVRACSANGEGL